tara:strand:- start:101 stop:1234 length:1134 start_codon:yes stop_codon:yes gene_type:complete
MLEYNYIIILINTIKKRLQLVFKEISRGIFKLFYGEIDTIETNSDRLEIINSTFDKDIKYRIYIVKNSRIYTDTINDTAIIHDNKIIEGPSFQIRDAKFASINENIVLSKGTSRIKKKIDGIIFSLLTGGAGNFNYWHWLFDVLPRIKILENSYNLDKIDYFLLPNLEKRFQKETLDILKIPNKKRLSSIKLRHISADQIISTDHPYVRNNNASYEIQNLPDWILNWLRNSFLKEKMFNDNSYPKKIFIDRSDATSNHSELRKILNEKEIIKELKLDGYKVVRLADIPFIEQVKTFFNAEKIIGLHGAGFANLIFCKPNTKILEIKPSTDGKVIENLANKLNLYYHALAKVPEKHNFNNQLGHLSISYEEIKNIFKI